MSYTIGSFNLCRLDFSKGSKAFKQIAKIIKGEHFDVVAMQELIASGENPNTLVNNQLMMALGNDWGIAVSSSDNPRFHNYSEGYGFIWNKGNRVDNKTDFDRTKYAFLSVDKVNYSKAKIVFNADTKKHLAALKAKKEKKSDDSSYDRVPRRGNGELTKEQFLNEEVIITPSGSCYHVDGCNTLRGSVSWIKRKDARNRGYSPCAKCHPDFGHAGW